MTGGEAVIQALRHEGVAVRVIASYVAPESTISR